MIQIALGVFLGLMLFAFWPYVVLALCLPWMLLWKIVRAIVLLAVNNIVTILFFGVGGTTLFLILSWTYQYLDEHGIVPSEASWLVTCTIGSIAALIWIFKFQAKKPSAKPRPQLLP